MIFRLVEWTHGAEGPHAPRCPLKKGERDRGAPATEDIKGAMEIGANAFNIISVWRDRKFEEKVELLRQTAPQEARQLFSSQPGVVMNVAKQRNGDFEGKVGLWFDQASYRYRSRTDGDGLSRRYLPEGWNNRTERTE